MKNLLKFTVLSRKISCSLRPQTLFLVSTAIFTSSIWAFFYMGWIFATRKIGIATNNAEEWFIFCNQLPQKLRMKVNKGLLEWTNIQMNIRSLQKLVELFCLFWKTCWVLSKFWYFHKNFVTHWCGQNLTRTLTAPAPAPRTAPYPHPHSGVWFYL